MTKLTKPGVGITHIANLRVGQKVHYQPEQYGKTRWENGIIKEIRQDIPDAIWVVYHCAGEWTSYKDYTGAKTNLRDLRLNWKFEE